MGADVLEEVAIMQNLTFDDALRIARGCTDYRGGYRDTKEYEAYQNGVRTVISALEAAQKSGLDDHQILALYQLGTKMEHGKPYKISSDGGAAVSTEAFWISISKMEPPRNVKMLLLNENSGVASIGRYVPDGWWTHWFPLPKLVKEDR